jgi:type II secretory pathway pseudopilin PulG
MGGLDMSAKRKSRFTGVTLIEVVVAMVIIMVAVLGAMGYRYYSVLDARKAKVQITAARLGSMLLENWKGTGGRAYPNDAFDPQLLGSESTLILVSPGGTGATVPGGFSLFGTYVLVADGANYYAALAYRDDNISGLRELNAAIAWPGKYPSGAFSTSDLMANFQSVRLTTKVDIPESI